METGTLEVLEVRKPRRARSAPRVAVYSRHREDCKWAGDDSRLSCDCPKWLRWFREGKLYRESADTYDGAVAETKAAEMVLRSKATAEGKPAPTSTKGKLLEEAQQAYYAAAEGRGVTQKQLGPRPRMSF